MEPSRQRVKEMFDAISPTYDRVNQILSLGLDAHWRKQLARYLPESEEMTLLDVATGTGDQLLTLLKKRPTIKKAYGLDIAPKMLHIGKQKIQKAGFADKARLIEGSALKLPFPDNYVDCVTISFGIRNVTDVSRALYEMQRVLKPGGRALILEFSLPPSRPIRALHLFYLRHVLPRIGGLISKQNSAYRYLNQTIETFPYGGDFCELMDQAQFQNCLAIPLTLGVVTLYVGDAC